MNQKERVEMIKKGLEKSIYEEIKKVEIDESLNMESTEDLADILAGFGVDGRADKDQLTDELRVVSDKAVEVDIDVENSALIKQYNDLIHEGTNPELEILTSEIDVVFEEENENTNHPEDNQFNISPMSEDNQLKDEQDLNTTNNNAVVDEGSTIDLDQTQVAFAVDTVSDELSAEIDNLQAEFDDEVELEQTPEVEEVEVVKDELTAELDYLTSEFEISTEELSANSEFEIPTEELSANSKFEIPTEELSATSNDEFSSDELSDELAQIKSEFDTADSSDDLADELDSLQVDVEDEMLIAELAKEDIEITSEFDSDTDLLGGQIEIIEQPVIDSDEDTDTISTTSAEITSEDSTFQLTNDIFGETVDDFYNPEFAFEEISVLDETLFNEKVEEVGELTEIELLKDPENKLTEEDIINSAETKIYDASSYDQLKVEIANELKKAEAKNEEIVNELQKEAPKTNRMVKNNQVNSFAQIDEDLQPAQSTPTDGVIPEVVMPDATVNRDSKPVASDVQKAAKNVDHESITEELDRELDKLVEDEETVDVYKTQEIFSDKEMKKLKKESKISIIDIILVIVLIVTVFLIIRLIGQ